MTDTVSSALTVSGATSPDADCSATAGNVVSCTLAHLAPGASIMVTVTYTVAPGVDAQTVHNVALADSDEADPRLSNDATVAVAREADTSSWPTMVTGRAVLLVIDEDSIDNGKQFSANPDVSIHMFGQDIKPSTTTKFSTTDVNDDRPSFTQREVLRYFAANVGKRITVQTGQTGDEGWCAPNVVPSRGATPAIALRNFVGANGTPNIPAQSKLTNVPDVRLLRALGLHRLEGQTVCALVYDNDINVNYGSRSPRITGKLEGQVLGKIAFPVEVDGVHKRSGFSSSTLPEVRILIEDAKEACGRDLRMFSMAPAPSSSSVPNDVDPHKAPSASAYPAP